MAYEEFRCFLFNLDDFLTNHFSMVGIWKVDFSFLTIDIFYTIKKGYPNRYPNTNFFISFTLSSNSI